MKKYLVSIIIPVRNAQKYVSACLAHIYAQTYRDFEVIMVNQDEPDTYRQIASSYRKKFENRLILINVAPSDVYSPPSVYRNKGARRARGDVLVHLDVDMYMDSRLLEDLVRIFRSEEDTVAVTIPEADITDSFWGSVKSMERRCYWGNSQIESARAVRTRIFMAIRGYDKGIRTGEDVEIHARYAEMGKIRYSGSFVRHDIRGFGLIADLKKKFSYGRTAKAYFRKSSASGFSYVLEEFLCYFRHYRMLLSNPVAAIGLFIMKPLEIAAGYFGMLRGL